MLLHIVLRSFLVAATGDAPSPSWPLLPRPVASFGAVSSDHWLYVYGGHTGKPHQHSTANVNGDFQRLNLLDGRSWETLTGGPALQSPALVAVAGRIVRIGGMTPKNAPGEKEDLDSTCDVAAYDPIVKTWTSLPPLPEARSSHDAVVLGDFVYVAGGWTLTAGKGSFVKTAYRMNMSSPTPKWEALPEAPFERRACALAAHRGQILVMGGITSEGKTSRAVDIFDIDNQSWRDGPELPSDGFGVAAVTQGELLLVSTRDGKVFRLDAGHAWVEHASLTIPRFFHRLVSLDEHRFAAIGGAGMDGGHLRLIEPIALDTKSPRTEVAAFTVPYPGAARNRQGAFLVNNGLVLFGGNNSVEQHDFEPANFVNEAWNLHLGTLEWSRVADFPVPRQSIQTLQISEPVDSGDNHGRRASLTNYAIGGFGHDGNAAVAFANGFEYSGGKEPWKGLDARLQEPRTQFGLAVHDGSILVFGGLDYDPRRGKEDAFQYPTKVTAWTFAPSTHDGGVVEASASRPSFRETGIELPRVRRAFGGAQLGDRYYLVCGMRQEFQLVEECDVYNFSTKAWETIPAPSRPRISPELVALDGKLYLVGGSSPRSEGSKVFERNTTIEVFDPAARAWSTLMSGLPVPAEHLRAMAFNGRILLFSVDPKTTGAFHLAFVKP